MNTILVISNLILVVSTITFIAIAAKYTHKSTKFELQCEVLTDMLKANGINVGTTGSSAAATTNSGNGDNKETVNSRKRIGFKFSNDIEQ